MKHTFSAAAALIATFSLAAAQTSAPKCGPGNNCPSSAPCCSQYGQCGAGAYCLGGCDPMHSFSLQSCMAAPTCKSADYKLDSLDDIAPNTKYLGDASKANWVSSGTVVAYNGDSVLLTMAPSTVGTLLSSTPEEMRSSYTAICAVLVLLLAAQAQLSVLAVTCNPNELSPCLPALTGPSLPTKACCVKINEQKPCLCQYSKNPLYKKYFDSSNAQKISTTCKIPFPKC